MESEEIYLTILNNLRDGIYFVDNKRKILFWNKAAQEITGYAPDEIVGKECQFSSLNHIDEKGHPLCTMGCPLFSTLIDGQQRQGHLGRKRAECLCFCGDHRSTSGGYCGFGCGTGR